MPEDVENAGNGGGGSRRKVNVSEGIDRARRKTRRSAVNLLGWIWNLALDLIWLAAVAAVVSAAIWGVYLAGRQAGWSNPALTAAAKVVEACWKGVLNSVRR
ncbi:MAG: hypothetical protein ACPLTR_08960 [Thermacetogeniaceae bacterium]